MTVTTSTFEQIVYEKRSAIAYITLNRPKVLNALNQATFTELGWLSKTPKLIQQCWA
jgi:enoyl-CoA hydratase